MAWYIKMILSKWNSILFCLFIIFLSNFTNHDIAEFHNAKMFFTLWNKKESLEIWGLCKIHFSTLSNITKITKMILFAYFKWQRFLSSGHSYFFLSNITLVLSMSILLWMCIFQGSWSQLNPRCGLWLF